MPTNLKGKTIILTGSTVVGNVSQLIEHEGGIVQHFPLIEVQEAIVDDMYINQLASYDWLIFTSQNGVRFFIEKCKRASIPLANIQSKIACVGSKTEELLIQHGFHVNFIPSTFSADVFVEEFSMLPHEKVLFIRGSLAKSTIRDRIAVDEWTVYETTACTTTIEPLKKYIQQCNQPILIFASPSAVRVFMKLVAQFVNMGKLQIASIGHVTTAELLKYGVKPNIQPEIYTMQAVVEQLILEEQSK